MDITTQVDTLTPELRPDLIGTGRKRSISVTRTGTATHFDREVGVRALCGAFTVYRVDADDWVSCTRCMAIARREAEAAAE